MNITVRLLLAAALFLAGGAHATGFATCDAGPSEGWQPQEKLEKELKHHEALSASKAHGKASGGKIDSAETKTTLKNSVKPFVKTKMDTAKKDKAHGTGDVKEGKPGGYKRGGKAQRKANGGAMKYVEGNVTGTPAGKSNTKTGQVTKSTKPGEYKKGGAAKKYADGGRVQDDGRPVKMPKKAASNPVAISRLSGTFKKGGSVERKNSGGPLGTQPNKEEQGEAAWRAGEKADNKALSEAMNPINWFKPLVDKFKGTPAAVVETTKSKTVVPAKKKYGGKAC